MRQSVLSNLMRKINPTIKFFTLGCKANQYDTQSIRERFLSRGFREAQSGLRPDYFLINTCTVTSGADQKSRNIIRRCIQSAPQAKMIVTGCLVENDWEQIQKIKGVSLIVKKSFFPEKISSFYQHTRAFLKIQDGCDNFCTYCKVALVRGRPRSKKIAQVLQEARQLAACGYKEIVLTGICLGAYGKDSGDKERLVDLLVDLEKVKGLLRVRLSSIEAGDVSPGLIGYFKKSKKFCRHLHIPIQSGDDDILKRMNRKYTAKVYGDLIGRLKAAIPGIAITTDCLIGFPGETEDNFKNTVKLVKEIMPLKVHIFPYSVRPQTKAAGFKEPVDPKIIRLRCDQLAKVASACRQNFMRKFTGSSAQVLIEGQPSGAAGFLDGLSDNYLKVRVPFEADLNSRIVSVRLKSIRNDYFAGENIDKRRI